MREGSRFVGMDVHKREIVVAVVSAVMEWSEEFVVANTGAGIARLARKLKREWGDGVRCCYEAGPCGYVVQRRLQAHGVSCVVVAPSLVPVKPGERIKTDRRDARKLAGALRAGTLTEVHPPTPEVEAVRDLCRCREDLREDLLRARHRLSMMLVRRGLVYGQGRAWTKAHRRWLQTITLEHEAERVVFEDYLLAVEQLEARMAAIGRELEGAAQREPFVEPVGWLRCVRGIDTLTALTIVAELHGFERFTSARELMAFVGLTPSEHSSGARRRRGGITKTGNRHVRRLLIEAAWHSRHRPGVGVVLARRRKNQPRWVIAIADHAQVRLHRRMMRLVLDRGKHANTAVAAVARELTGFIWAILSHGQRQHSTDIRRVG